MEGEVTAQVDDIKKAHHALMVEYVDILNRVSKLDTFVDFQVKLPLKNDVLIPILRWIMKYLTLAFLVRLFVEFHIKGKLRELNISYVQHALVVDESSKDKYPEWRKQTKEASAEFIDTLSLWQGLLWISTTIWLLVGGLFVSIVQSFLGGSLVVFKYINQANFSGFIGDVKTKYSMLTELNASGVFQVVYHSYSSYFEDIVKMLIVVAYFLICISLAFAYKRTLFLPGSGFLWFDHAGTERAQTIKNIYEMEDGLFDLLEKGKNRESRTDIAALVLFWFILGVIFILLPFFKKWILISDFGIVYYFVFLISWMFGFYKLSKIQRRWR